MSKLVYFNPIVIHACKECPQHRLTTLGEHYCMAHTMALKDFPIEWLEHMIKASDKMAYAYISHPDRIPSWCSLEEATEND